MSHRIHPWRKLRDLGPTWTLEWSTTLPYDVYGFTNWATRTITIRTGLSFEERRCTALHEVEHVLRGPASRCDELREESLIDRRCARMLLPSMRDVVDSLIYHHGDYEATASDLWVDLWTLEVRLGSLHRRENDYLQRRLADVILTS